MVLGWAFVDPSGNYRTQTAWATVPLRAAVLIRCGTVPAHCWVTDWFEHASFGNALLFVTPLTGIYAAVRLVLPIAPDWALRSSGLISLATAVYAAGMAVVPREARRFFASVPQPRVPGPGRAGAAHLHPPDGGPGHVDLGRAGAGGVRADAPRPGGTLRPAIDNGARTRFADLFLLGFVASVPWLIHRIPLAALGAMLVYTGFRLALPRELANVWKTGREQLVIFASTLVGVLATDLLMGIAIGIGVKFLLHVANGLPLSAMFRPCVLIEQRNEKTYLVLVKHFAIFTNWILLRRLLLSLEADRDVTLDLSDTRLVDHTVMEKLHELQKEFGQANRRLEVVGREKRGLTVGSDYQLWTTEWQGFRQGRVSLIKFFLAQSF